MSVPSVYGNFRPQIDGFSWPAMRTALYQAHSADMLDRLIVDIPEWPVSEMAMHWGKTAWSMSAEWFRYIRMAIDAGYYALTIVNHAQTGTQGIGDHWVLLCGAREVRRQLGEMSWTTDEEVLVSCPSTRTPAEEWVRARDFLFNRGGFNALLARPKVYP